MSKTGWGQIPVVDQDQSKVIGIVTRTDLLKTLRMGEASLPGHINLAEKLENTLPEARIALLHTIKEAADESRLPIYIVGGFVRDLILNHPCEDFDIVVEGDAITLARSLSKSFGGKVVTHKRFGTAKWQTAEIVSSLTKLLSKSTPLQPHEFPESLDFISARKEFYEYPTALPRVERGSIKLDLHRRDFTINTMALRLDGHHYGELYDFWGGLTDLKQKLVRGLHSLSFVDDPTRMLRAVRFEQRFGFHIETRTLQLIKEAKDLLRQISGDRLRHEFILILHESNPPVVFQRLQNLGLLESIHPALTWQQNQKADWDVLFNTPAFSDTQPGQEDRIDLGWAALLFRLESVLMKEVTVRLKLPSSTIKILSGTSQLRTQISKLPDLSVPEAVKILDRIPEVSIHIVRALDPHSPGATTIDKYLEDWKHIHPGITGKHLEELGIPGGPIYRVILDSLRDAWLNGTITSQEEEIEHLHKLIHKLN